MAKCWKVKIRPRWTPIHPIVNAYKTRLILSLSSYVWGHMSIKRYMPCEIGTNPFLDSSTPNVLAFFPCMGMSVHAYSFINHEHA